LGRCAGNPNKAPDPLCTPSLASLRDAWLAFADPEVYAKLRPPALFCHPCGMVLLFLRDGGGMPTRIDKGTGKIAPPPC
jgi:hypothetical protein